MKKNQRLLEIIGELSPHYAAEAAPGKQPAPQQHRSHRRSGRILSLIAAMLALALMSFGMGFTVSALQPGAAEEGVRTGTLLMDIPEILTYNDWQWLLGRVEAGMAADTDVPEDTRGHWLKRFEAFYTLQDIELQQSEKAKQTMLTVYPITEVVAVYTVDPHLTAAERDYLYQLMVKYGGITQADLIAMHRTMYDLVAGSGLPAVKQQTICTSLPALPGVSPYAPAVADIDAAAAAAGKTPLSPAALPYVLLAEDYDRIVAAALEACGVEMVAMAPRAVQEMLACFTRYPLTLDKPENHHVMTEQHFAPLSADVELYALDPTLSMEERVMLAYRLSMLADVWEEDVVGMANKLFAVLKTTYADRPGTLDAMESLIRYYWGNYGHLLYMYEQK